MELLELHQSINRASLTLNRCFIDATRISRALFDFPNKNLRIFKAKISQIRSRLFNFAPTI